jgi:hypothetical protein
MSVPRSAFSMSITLSVYQCQIGIGSPLATGAHYMSSSRTR